MALKFHNRVGTLVTLSNNNCTAQRNHPTQEFNNGVVMSAEPLQDNVPFEVRIDRKVNSWSGSIEIGVTTCDPSTMKFPISATGFREGTWVMSGSSILRDGHSVIEEYGADLDQLNEGEKVGVMRTTDGTLHFLVNGVDQGPAANGIAAKVYAVIDMYGKCAQVTIVDNAPGTNQENDGISNDVASQLANEFLTQLSNQIVNDLTRNVEALGIDTVAPSSNERLTFHERCGSLVKLSNSRRTAERRHPLDEFNNGVVMTNRPLKNDELFEIRLDVLVDKWSGSIEVGITTHNPSVLDFPATMTNMRSDLDVVGTIMMSGCGILTNGKGTRREYGVYNLDELTEGDRIGLIRKSNGHLHYYINGEDQGVASNETPPTIWGVVDLYGMAVKVSILDRNDPNYPNNISSPAQRARNIFRQYPDMYDEISSEEAEPVERLLFHTRCGSHAAVINNQRTAHRPNALDDFNYGVVLTNRTLRPEELFEVHIDKMVDKWAGSIEIGVTLHSPNDLDFPSTMTNMRSGTWMMTGTGVMHNGTTVIDMYGQNLDRLKAGDRVGVKRRGDGTLHFYVNGIDQGQGATGVPPNVYGVIDLYGQAAQTTIVDHTDPLSPDADSSNISDTEELRFHHIHGQNSTIANNGRTCLRPNATGEFNDAIIMSSRPLKDNELFEVIIEKMVDRWSGSLEAGVTLIKPEELEFPNTMTDIAYDTWMLSGAAIMQDGSTIRNGYPLDLDAVTVGCRIGIMRCSDGTLHYFLNGADQGAACSDVPHGIFAVIDLYGQCAQVSITSGSGVYQDNNLPQSDQAIMSPSSSDVSHRFSLCCGKCITIKNNSCTTVRSTGYNNAIVFSSDPLKRDEIFEIRIDQVCRVWSGSLHIGLTTLAISDTTSSSIIPASALELTSKLTWLITGSEVRKNGFVIKENYAPALERLEVGNFVGIRRVSDGTLHLYINGEDMGVAASNIPKNVFVVIDLYGPVEMITITSSCSWDASLMASQQSQSITSELAEAAEFDADEEYPNTIGFHTNHGKNIMISNGGLTADRTESYNQGIIVTSQPLRKKHMFQVRIEHLNTRWSFSLMIGVLGFPPDKYTFPVSSMSIKKSCIMIQGNAVYSSGCKIKENYGPNLDELQIGHVIGIMVDEESNLRLFFNGVDQGVAARDVPGSCYGLVDLYGICDKVTVVPNEGSGESPEPHHKDKEKAEKENMEEVLKEKQSLSESILGSVVIRPCEYAKTCSKVRSLMGIPDGFFLEQQMTCYCESCHKLRLEDLYLRRGEPPREYSVPLGWCRYILKQRQKASSFVASDKWHVAYYGTQLEVLRKILDTGDIHACSDQMGGGSILLPQSIAFTEKSRPDSSSLKQIIMSPTIRYIGCNEFSPKFKLLDPRTKKTFHVRVAFQVWLKPGSYKTGPQSLGLTDQIDPQFPNSELEWSTKEHGSVLLHGLLIKIENL
ncbi:neuralized-like protein 4 isoform X1 [Magallana gigas]|uniref:neuralized-like protein 4 isoform X1 n=1 Tax=Magallana gigas TaxID=29159 RepID=UPI003342732C